MWIDRLWLTAEARCGKQSATGSTELTQRVVQKRVMFLFILFITWFCQLLKIVKIIIDIGRLKYNHLIAGTVRWWCYL